MSGEEVRELGDDELKAKQVELQERVFRLRFQQSLGQLDNPMKIRETRRDIARVSTEMRDRQRRKAAETAR